MCFSACYCDTYCKLHGNWTATIESEASFIAEHRLKHKHHPFEWCVFQKKSAPWIGLCILSLHCVQFIQVHRVYSHGLPLCEKRWILLDYISQGCGGAKCLQLHSVLAFKEWENETVWQRVWVWLFSSLHCFIGHSPGEPSFFWAGSLQKADGQATVLFNSMVPHKHSILFVGPANIKYLNRHG